MPPARAATRQYHRLCGDDGAQAHRHLSVLRRRTSKSRTEPGAGRHAARLLKAKEDEENAKYAAERKGQIGTGDRSERIRTYNYPQGRLTDHRIGMNLSLPPAIDGGLDELIEALHNVDYEARIKIS